MLFSLGLLLWDVGEINALLSSVGGLIQEFNSLLNASNVTSFSEVHNVMSGNPGSRMLGGGLFTDEGSHMAQSAFKKMQMKSGAIDRAIQQEFGSLSELFRKGSELESNIIKTDPSYTSQLDDKMETFIKLRASYRGN